MESPQPGMTKTLHRKRIDTEQLTLGHLIGWQNKKEIKTIPTVSEIQVHIFSPEVCDSYFTKRHNHKDHMCGQPCLGTQWALKV